MLLCAGIRIGLEAVGLAALAAHDQPVCTNALELWNRWDAQACLRLADVLPLVVAGAALQGWLMWRYSVGQWTF